MVRQRITWTVAVAFAIAIGTCLAAPPLATADGPITICAPTLPSVPVVPTSCPQGSQTQSQPGSSSQSTQSQSAPRTTKQFSVTAVPDLARALVTEVNRMRRAHGLRPLAISTRLTDAATAHAQVLAAAGQFTHAWPTTGQLFGSWIRGFYPARGYRAWSVGENLLWASPGFTPTSAVQQWLDSPAHRRVLLTAAWRELGIGVVSAVGAPGAFGGRDVQIAAAEFGMRKA